MNPEDNNQGINETPGPLPERQVVPFEDPAKDFFTGLFETLRLVLFQPTHFFKSHKLDGAIGRPLLFALLVGTVSNLISLLWGLLVSESVLKYLGRFSERFSEGGRFGDLDLGRWQMTSQSIEFALEAILTPLGVVIGLFIMAGIYHLFLMIVKGARKNFETTFNVAAYGIAAQVALVFPICGSLVATVYGIVLGIIGLTEAHETESGKAVFAVLGPFILCCVCCILLLMFIGGTASLAPLFKKMPWF